MWSSRPRYRKDRALPAKQSAFGFDSQRGLIGGLAESGLMHPFARRKCTFKAGTTGSNPVPSFFWMSYDICQTIW